MTIEEARHIVAMGKPARCGDKTHAHGTWGLAEIYDRTCEAYVRGSAYNRAVGLLSRQAKA